MSDYVLATTNTWSPSQERILGLINNSDTRQNVVICDRSCGMLALLVGLVAGRFWQWLNTQAAAPAPDVLDYSVIGLFYNRRVTQQFIMRLLQALFAQAR